MHGGDFTSDGRLQDQRWMDEKLRECFQIKSELFFCRVCASTEVKFLNRIRTLSNEGNYWAPAVAHVDLIIRHLALC